MRFVRIAVAVLYLAAVTASAGTPLCQGADGHCVYEISFGSCCDPHEEGHHEDDGCESSQQAHFEAGPPCGLCDDSLAPLPGGLKSAAAAVVVVNDIPAIGAPAEVIAGSIALDLAPIPLPSHFTLRC